MGFFSPMVKNLVFWFPIYSVLWIWSSGPARSCNTSIKRINVKADSDTLLEAQFDAQWWRWSLILYSNFNIESIAGYKWWLQMVFIAIWCMFIDLFALQHSKLIDFLLERPKLVYWIWCNNQIWVTLRIDFLKNGPRNTGFWTQDLPILNPTLNHWANSPLIWSEFTLAHDVS